MPERQHVFQQAIRDDMSRNLGDLTLYLYLKDAEGRERYRFCLDCDPGRFREVTYEAVQKVHGTHIAQKETDSIADGEIRFFAWKRCADWGGGCGRAGVQEARAPVFGGRPVLPVRA